MDKIREIDSTYKLELESVDNLEQKQKETRSIMNTTYHL